MEKAEIVPNVIQLSENFILCLDCFEKLVKEDSISFRRKTVCRLNYFVCKHLKKMDDREFIDQLY